MIPDEKEKNLPGSKTRLSLSLDTKRATLRAKRAIINEQGTKGEDIDSTNSRASKTSGQNSSTAEVIQDLVSS